jgi:large subunit ribosomal protein MRP49
MTLERTTNQEGPALMTVYFDDATQPETPVAGTQTEPTTSSQQRVVTINMKHRHESEILSQLLALTNAVPVEPTPEEVEQLQQLAAQQEVSERDSARHAIFNAEKKREKAILAQARTAA